MLDQALSFRSGVSSSPRSGGGALRAGDWQHNQPSLLDKESFPSDSMIEPSLSRGLRMTFHLKALNDCGQWPKISRSRQKSLYVFQPSKLAGRLLIVKHDPTEKDHYHVIICLRQTSTANAVAEALKNSFIKLHDAINLASWAPPQDKDAPTLFKQLVGDGLSRARGGSWLQTGARCFSSQLNVLFLSVDFCTTQTLVRRKNAAHRFNAFIDFHIRVCAMNEQYLRKQPAAKSGHTERRRARLGPDAPDLILLHKPVRS